MKHYGQKSSKPRSQMRCVVLVVSHRQWGMTRHIVLRISDRELLRLLDDLWGMDALTGAVLCGVFRLTFSDVKISAISNLIQLERLGLVTREDSFQGVLDAIAGDVRSKHRKRLERQREMDRMNEALQQLAQRKKLFEEKIESYHNYVEAAMNTMQKGKG